MIKANDDLTPEHHQFFLYQMLRGLKYIHTGVSCSHMSACEPSHMLLGQGCIPAMPLPVPDHDCYSQPSVDPTTDIITSCRAAKVYHRDLKPKNILANSDCKLKVRWRFHITAYILPYREPAQCGQSHGDVQVFCLSMIYRMWCISTIPVHTRQSFMVTLSLTYDPTAAGVRLRAGEAVVQRHADDHLLDGLRGDPVVPRP